MSERTNILVKYNLLYIAMVIFGIVVIGKIIYLQFFYDKSKIEEALKSTRIYTTVEPNRGDIYSYDGKLLATSVAYYEAGFDPNCDAISQEVFDENIDSLTLCLSQLFTSKTQAQFKNEITTARDKGLRYYRFSFNINYSNFKLLKTFPLIRKGRTKGGFVYIKTFRREQPFGLLARRTIGTEPAFGRKGVGLEDAFDKDLRGIEGHTIKEKIPGNMWMPVEDANYIEPKDGYDLITTIDIGLQDVAETALERQMIRHNAEFGTVVVMEVKTGKVRAIANLKKHPDGYYFEETNFAVGHAADPGSTFKLASVIIAIEDGYVKPEDSIKTGNGKIRYHGREMKDTKVGGYGTITVKKAFEVSSNVGISKIIHDNYKDQPEKYIAGLKRLHLDEKLNVVIRGEGEPVIHIPGTKEWSGLSLTQMSIGYELQITPLQILTLYNSIANNGVMVKPIFAESLSYRGEIIKIFGPEIIDPQICSQKTVDIVKSMMEGVVEEGTATRLKNENYKVAGKTGTAQMQYGNDTLEIEYHASFVGYFPADNPEYSIVVSVYKPRSNGFYGTVVAAPVFKEIADKIYATNSKYHSNSTNTFEPTIPFAKKGNKNETEAVYSWLKIPTNNNKVVQTEWIYPEIAGTSVKYNPISFSDKTRIPSVVNMGLKDAIIVLEQMGFVVHVSGRGRVYKQVPEAGGIYSKGETVQLFLGE